MGVIGAGVDSVNGWYDRKEHADGPPEGWLDLGLHVNWDQANAGPWYLKNDGCFLYYKGGYEWNITPNRRQQHGGMYGYFQWYDSDEEQQFVPPSHEWRSDAPGSSDAADYPTPTLRVVT